MEYIILFLILLLQLKLITYRNTFFLNVRVNFLQKIDVHLHGFVHAKSSKKYVMNVE